MSLIMLPRVEYWSASHVGRYAAQCTVLGRLDRQKGIHHLAEVMEVVQNTGLNVRWRIIGKPVVNDSAVPIPSVVTDVLEAEITDPVRLGEVYAWADVVILLSSYEGLPLVVLEGMRAGAVVVATDVGAVSEVIRNNENGILLSGPDRVSCCLAALRTLQSDRLLLKRLSRQAVADASTRDWHDAVRALSSYLSGNEQ